MKNVFFFQFTGVASNALQPGRASVVRHVSGERQPEQFSAPVPLHLRQSCHEATILIFIPAEAV